MKTNRIFKEHYSVRPSKVFALNYGMASEKVAENEYKIRIILDENESVVLNEMVFSSHDEIQDYVSKDNVFKVTSYERDTIHTHTFKDTVLIYEVVDGKLIAVTENERFFTIGEVDQLGNYVDLKAIEGKTVSEVVSIYNEWKEDAYSDYEHEMGKAMYGFYYGGNSVDDCSSCGGGGCIHCSPKDFI